MVSLPVEASECKGATFQMKMCICFILYLQSVSEKYRVWFFKDNDSV